jgi:hypothetical protein
VSGGAGAEQRVEAAVEEENEAYRSQKDPFAISQKVQGSLYKLKISHCYKILMRKMSKGKL